MANFKVSIYRIIEMSYSTSKRKDTLKITEATWISFKTKDNILIGLENLNDKDKLRFYDSKNDKTILKFY